MLNANNEMETLRVCCETSFLTPH